MLCFLKNYNQASDGFACRATLYYLLKWVKGGLTLLADIIAQAARSTSNRLLCVKVTQLLPIRIHLTNSVEKVNGIIYQ